MTENQNVYEFQAEIKKLLNILSKSLYTHKEIFLRELISNAVDALKKMKFILLTDRDVVDPDAELKIDILFNPDEKTLTIRDTGVGMTKNELISDLGTIAGSGTEKFVARLQEMREEGEKEVDLDIIGQFGIGFYSVYMVADKVELITRSYQKEEPAYRWQSDGTGKFSIESSDKDSRGTEVILYLHEEDAEEYLNQYRIETIIRKYSNFVSFPIYVSEVGKTAEEKKKKEEEEKKKKKEEGEEVEEEEKEPEPVNETQPLWRKRDKDISEEEYKSFYNYIAKRYDNYLDVINYRVDGQVQFRSILFIPETSSRELFLPEVEYGISLYSRNVLIMDNCEELIPRWMRFVKGVLESEDIPLNISRETIQTNRRILKMSDLLTKKFLREISDMAEKEPETYLKFWNEFGEFIKEGIISDQVRQKKLKNLLRFRTSKTEKEELIGLKDYLDRMKDDQEEIFYLVGENLENMKISPHLGYYQENDLEVILFDEPIDNFLMMNMQNYTITEGEGEDKEVKIFEFKPIDVAEKPKPKEREEKEEEKEKEEKEVPEDTQKFLDKVQEILGEKIIEARISERLYGSPCRLANPAGGPTSSQQRAMRYWTQTKVGQQFQIPKKILEFNPKHPMIKNLIEIHAQDSDNESIEPIIEQLFENSLLSEGDLPDPASMVPRINKLLEMLVSKKEG